MSETNRPFIVNPETVYALYGEPDGKTLRERIEEDGITLNASHIGDSKDLPDGDVWRVTLGFEGRTMSLPYHMGSGYKGAAPAAEQVLEALLLGASGVESTDGFEEWAGDYGFDLDADRWRAERIYHDAVAQTLRLEQLLGDRYEDYLRRTEY